MGIRDAVFDSFFTSGIIGNLIADLITAHHFPREFNSGAFNSPNQCRCDRFYAWQSAAKQINLALKKLSAA